MIALWSNWCIRVRNSVVRSQFSVLRKIVVLQAFRAFSCFQLFMLVAFPGWRHVQVKSSVLRRLIVALILAATAFAQSSGSSSDAVAQYVKAEMARQHIPG